ncbi:MAG: bifunctional folylpolyglutamate synthase/dihydrofolate synthase [Coriobacteriia bacterium]|nr:bifunctional folylpolyglutamate synthase/dihydrofolate synthase [Coriobacteriia bacterium]
MEGAALTYSQAIARLSESLVFGINPSLDGIRALTEALGNPQNAFKCIQITGTNGKTSVARISGALLRTTGYRTGVYTSPHLVSYAERFEIDGELVSEAELAEVLGRVFEVADALDTTFTEFELLTAAALELFRARGVEWAVLEVGMGGRWDATSIINPAVAVITGVGLDHTNHLGATREEIAADKAHIIKRGAIPIFGPGCEGVLDILEKRAADMGSPVIGRVGVGLDPDVTWKVLRRPRSPGGTLTLDVEVHTACTYRVSVRAPSYQAPNIATAMAAVGAALLEVGHRDLVFSAINSVTFPGRFEVLRKTPALVIDGAHNVQAAQVLAGAIDEAFGCDKPVIVLGVLADKDVEGMVRELAPRASSFIATQNSSPRSMSAEELADVIEKVTGVRPEVERDIEAAVGAASATGRGVVVTGSLYTAGAVRALMLRWVCCTGVLLESR